MKQKAFSLSSNLAIAFTLLLAIIGQTTLFAQSPSGQLPGYQDAVKISTESHPVLRNHLNSLAQKGMITTTDASYVVTSQHVSSLSGAHHIYYRQAINGVEVIGTESSLHLTKEGEAVRSNDRKLIKDINSKVKNKSASLSASQAIAAIASQMNYGSVTNLQEITDSKSSTQDKRFTNGGISGVDIPANLRYYLVPNEGIKMIWEISIQETNSADWWNFYADASSGAIIDKHNYTKYCNINDHSNHKHSSIGEDVCVDTAEASSLFNNNTVGSLAMTAADGASYNVYAHPLESPYQGGRSVVVDPADPAASPFGWHDTNGVAGAEFTTTAGNNTIAADDIASDDDTTIGSSPDGGASLVFNYTIDDTQMIAGLTVPRYTAGTPSLDAAITNAFYWVNISHDITYHYGFDEAAGNFQQNNYGNGGSGNDAVLTDVQDGNSALICNGNFSTTNEGFQPRMQLFPCPPVDIDGAYDNLVIVHEYAHGISVRLTGGPDVVSGLTNQEEAGEGWSDYYGYMLTMSTSNYMNNRTIGTFNAGVSPFNPTGIRTFPYSTDMGANPQTYQTLIDLGDGPMAPHPIGEIWAVMLFEMTQALIGVHGFDADIYTGTGGNNISLALVTEGLKLQPTSPGFVDARDAILLADQMLYGGANQCIIWEAFAKRGLGFSADQGDSDVRSDGTVAFDTPPTRLDLSENDVCLTNGLTTLSGGLFAGGTYSGPGVTDDGNGTTFTFDPTAAGLGTHTITYSAVDCSGAMSTDTDTITVADIPLEISGCPDVTLSLGPDGTAVYNPFVGGETEVNIVGVGIGQAGANSTLFLTLTEAATISFDWSSTSADLGDVAVFISNTGNGGNLNGFFPISNNTGGATQSGSFTFDLLAGDLFGFVVLPNNTNTVTATFTNFSPGYSGQFDTSNWAPFFGGVDETASSAIFNVPAGALLSSCGEVTTSLSQEVFTCLDIGTTTAVTVTVTDSQGNEDTCTANVTVTGGAINTSTFAGGTWSDGAPTGTSMAMVNADYDTGALGPINACSCEIASGRTVTIKDGDFMKVAGNIVVNGTLIVENEGSIVQIDEDAVTVNNGTIEVRKTTPLLGGRDFTVLSSPMTGETKNDVLQNANRVWEIQPALFTPHPDVTTAINFIDENFDYFVPPTTLESGRGYLVFPLGHQETTTTTLAHTYTLGTLHSGTITYPLEYNGPSTGNNFNVVGNPYASAINADMLIVANDAIDQVYFWEHLTGPSASNPGDNGVNHSMDDVSVYNLTGGIAAQNGGTAPGRYIVSGQGFGVLADQTEALSATPLTFTNAMRVTDNNGTVRSQEEDSNNKIWLRLSDENRTAGSTMLIGFMEDATPEFDKGYDSKRIASTISLYSQITEEEQLSIQGREKFSTESTVLLGFESTIEEETSYTISIDNISGAELLESDVYLEDNLLGTIANLKNGEYTFTAISGNNPGRFTLSFVEKAVLSTEDVIAGELGLYPNPSTGFVTLSYRGTGSLRQASIIDINGKVLRKVDLTGFENTHNFDLSAFSTGMYFMQIEMQDNVITKKVILN